jgi:hypothetical protein
VCSFFEKSADLVFYIWKTIYSMYNLQGSQSQEEKGKQTLGKNSHTTL